MGVRVSGNERLERSLDPARLMTRVEEIVNEVLGEGAEKMRTNIETRGTGKRWSHPWGPNGRTSSSPGRVDTGQMVREVQGEVIASDNTSVTGVLGWPEGSPEYYRHQEHGFNHVLTGEDVEEMRALRDAADETTPELIYELTRIARQM